MFVVLLISTQPRFSDLLSDGVASPLVLGLPVRGSGCSFNTGPTWRTCLLSCVVAQTGIDDQRCAPQRA